MSEERNDRAPDIRNFSLAENLTPIPSRHDDNIDVALTDNPQKMRGFVLFIVMFSLCLVQFLAALDITIVATALPTIAKQLEVNGAQYAWVGSSYNLASTTSVPLWSKCSDIWGRKPMLLLSNAAFMAGSLIAGLAKSGAMLIAGRTLQGLGGGGINIMVSIIIADLFALNERAKYYGLSSVVWAISSAMGPVLGGVFTQTIGWKWCFLINLPFDGISLALLWFVLRIQTPKLNLIDGLKSFDWIGAALMVGGVICFLCGLEGGASSSHSWSSAYTLLLLLSGVAQIAAFICYELYFAKFPLMPMRVFVGRSNVAALTSSSLHSFVFIAYDYFLPLYYQVILGASPIQSGVYLFALVIPLSVMSAGTGLYIKKTGKYHYAAWAGSLVMTIGTGLFVNLDRRRVLWKIILYQMIAGIGTGPLFLSPMIALQNHLRKEDTAAGTSALTSLRTISTTISIVVGSVILQKGLNSESLTTTNMSNHISKRTTTSTSAEADAYQERYVTSLHHMWIFYVALCGLVTVSSFMIRKKNHAKSTSNSADGNSSTESDGDTKKNEHENPLESPETGAKTGRS